MLSKDDTYIEDEDLEKAKSGTENCWMGSMKKKRKGVKGMKERCYTSVFLVLS